VIARLAALIGVPVSALAWVGFILAVVGSAAVSGALVHSYDRAQHDKVVADLRRDAAEALAEETGKVLALLQAEIDRNAELEAKYARLAQDTARAQADGARLSADLDAARQRLLQFTRAGGRGGGGAKRQAGADASGCETVRAALARTLAALERLERGGDEAAELGQHAVDVATIAAQAAQAARTKDDGRE